MVRIQATFQGSDGSVGYVKGVRYNLIVKDFSIKRQDSSGYTTYANLKTFLENWDNIIVLP